MRTTLPTLVFALALAGAASAQAPAGKTLFEKHCRKCHGDGRPSPAMKKLLPELPTWDEAFFAKRTDDRGLVKPAFCADEMASVAPAPRRH